MSEVENNRSSCLSVETLNAIITTILLYGPQQNDQKDEKKTNKLNLR